MNSPITGLEGDENVILLPEAREFVRCCPLQGFKEKGEQRDRVIILDDRRFQMPCLKQGCDSGPPLKATDTICGQQ